MGSSGVNVLPSGNPGPAGRGPGRSGSTSWLRRRSGAAAGGKPSGLPDGNSPGISGPPRGPVPWNDHLAGSLLLSLGVTWLTLLSALLFWANVPVLIGWQPRVVLSGSMLPALHPGDVALIASGPPTVPPGRVALVPDPNLPGGTFLHRVIRVDEAGAMTTQGDANPTPDIPAVPPGGTLGELRMVIPRVGAPVVWSRQGRPAPVVGVVVLTLGSLGLVLVRDRPLPPRRRPGSR